MREDGRSARANHLAQRSRISPRLKEIYDPPVILFVKGSIDVLAQPGIAMVGTRHPTPYGSGMAERLSTDLAARGLVIISGLARGIDTASHRGAVAAKGKTIAVLGTGIDVMYPKENTRLTEQIVALGGALITEFPVGTPPTPQNFPFATGSSAACRPACWWWKPRNTAARASRRVSPLNKTATFTPFRQCDQQKFLGAEHADQAGSETRRHVGRRVGRAPTDVQVALSSLQNESPEPETASLFPDEVIAPRKKYPQVAEGRRIHAH